MIHIIVISILLFPLSALSASVDSADKHTTILRTLNNTTVIADQDLMSDGVNWIEVRKKIDGNHYKEVSSHLGHSVNLKDGGIYRVKFIQRLQLNDEVMNEILWVQDVYVPFQEFSYVDAEKLAHKYMPVLHFHKDEEYFPVSLESITDLDPLKELTINADDNKLNVKYGSELKSFLSHNGHIDYLIDTESKLDNPATCELPCESHPLRELKISSNGKPVVYWEVSEEDSDLYVTYHFFYAFDPKVGTAQKPHMGAHAFDRESFTIRFSPLIEPVEVIYGAHMDNQTMRYRGDKNCNTNPYSFDACMTNDILASWKGGKVSLPWGRAIKIGTHPSIYIAKGAHAIYPTYGYYSVFDPLIGERLIEETGGGLGSDSATVAPYGYVLKKFDVARDEFLNFSGDWVDILGPGNAKFPPFTGRFPYGAWAAGAAQEFNECFYSSIIEKCSYFSRVYGTKSVGAVEVRTPDNIRVRIRLESDDKTEEYRWLEDENSNLFFYDRSETGLKVVAIDENNKSLSCDSFLKMNYGSGAILNVEPSIEVTDEARVPIVECRPNSDSGNQSEDASGVVSGVVNFSNAEVPENVYIRLVPQEFQSDSGYLNYGAGIRCKIQSDGRWGNEECYIVSAEYLDYFNENTVYQVLIFIDSNGDGQFNPDENAPCGLGSSAGWESWLEVECDYTQVPNVPQDGSLLAHYSFDNGFTNALTSLNDAPNWENAENVTIQNGVLILQNNYDYDPNRFANYAIDTTNIDILAIEKRSKIIAVGNYSISQTSIANSINQVAVVYNNYHYSGSNNVGQYDNREHFYLSNTVSDNGTLNSHSNSSLIAPRFNQWIRETIILNYINKSFSYTISDDDGSNVETINLDGIELDRDMNSKVLLNAWDWADGTQHVIDDLKIYIE